MSTTGTLTFVAYRRRIAIGESRALRQLVRAHGRISKHRPTVWTL